MNVLSWTAKGWKTKDITAKGSIRPIYNPTEEKNTSTKIGEFALFDEIKRNIQAGSPEMAIDALPPNLRILYENNGEFFVGDYGIFRFMPAEEQVQEHNDWGADDDDLEDEIIKEEMSYLEEDGTVVWEEKNTSDKDTTAEAIRAEEERIHSHILSNYETMIEEADLNGDTILRDSLIIQCADEMRLVNTEKRLQYSINSKFTASGYHAPKQKVQPVENYWNNDLGEAAETRRDLFNDFFVEISLCRTKQEIYGKPTEINGKLTFNGGILEKFRDAYNTDKELRKEWSNEAKQKARKEFILNWRNKQNTNALYDEESLRENLYFRFDRVSKTQPAEFIKEDGNVIKIAKDRRVTKSSFWDQDKQKAFKQLHLTYAQWSAIYKMKDILIKRIEMNKIKDSNRNEVLELMRDDFLKIKTLEDLKAHIFFVLHRSWKKKVVAKVPYKKSIKITKGENKGTIKEIDCEKKVYADSYEFIPSLLDQISTEDEVRWRTQIRRVGRELSLKEKKS